MYSFIPVVTLTFCHQCTFGIYVHNCKSTFSVFFRTIKTHAICRVPFNVCIFYLPHRRPKPRQGNAKPLSSCTDLLSVLQTKTSFAVVPLCTMSGCTHVAQPHTGLHLAGQSEIKHLFYFPLKLTQPNQAKRDDACNTTVMVMKMTGL